MISNVGGCDGFGVWHELETKVTYTIVVSTVRRK